MNYGQWIFYISVIIGSIILCVLSIRLWIDKREAASGGKKKDIILAKVSEEIEQLKYQLLNKEYGASNSISKLSKEAEMLGELLKSESIEKNKLTSEADKLGAKAKKVKSKHMALKKEHETKINAIHKERDQYQQEIEHYTSEIKWAKSDAIYYEDQIERNQAIHDHLQQIYNKITTSHEQRLKHLDETIGQELAALKIQNQQEEQFYNNEITIMKNQEELLKQEVERKHQILSQLHNQRMGMDKVNHQLTMNDQEIKELNYYIASLQQSIDKEKNELGNYNKIEIRNYVQAIKQLHQEHEFLEEVIIELTNEFNIKEMEVDESNQHRQTQQQDSMEFVELPDQVNFEIMESIELPIQINVESMEFDEDSFQHQEQEPMQSNEPSIPIYLESMDVGQFNQQQVAYQQTQHKPTPAQAQVPPSFPTTTTTTTTTNTPATTITTTTNTPATSRNISSFETRKPLDNEPLYNKKVIVYKSQWRGNVGKVVSFRDEWPLVLIESTGKQVFVKRDQIKLIIE